MRWRDLEVWKKAHGLVVETYRLTARFPAAEKYGLVNQLRRSASSVPANIAEGHGRNTTRDYASYLYNARGSVEETRYFLLLARDLNYLSPDGYQKIEAEYEKVSKMLNGLIKSLKTGMKG